MKKLSIIICFLLISTPCFAVTYNYYFDTTAGAGTCLVDDPCSTLAQAQTKIDDATDSDIVNLFYGGEIKYSSSGMLIK